MAIVHDLAEALVGDITPHDGVSNEKKHELEQKAMDTICNTLGNTAEADEILSLWNEYEAGSSAEAILVKDFDKFEMILQADEYEVAEEDKDLSDFFESTKDYFKTPLVKQWASELRSQRSRRKVE